MIDRSKIMGLIKLNRVYITHEDACGSLSLWDNYLRELYKIHPFHDYWKNLTITVFESREGTRLEKRKAAGLFHPSENLIEASMDWGQNAIIDTINHEVGHFHDHSCRESWKQIPQVKRAFDRLFKGLEGDDEIGEKWAEAARITIGIKSLRWAYRDVKVLDEDKHKAITFMRLIWSVVKSSEGLVMSEIDVRDDGIYWSTRPWWRFWYWDKRTLLIKDLEI